MLRNEELFEKNILQYPFKFKFDGQTLIKCDFLKGRLPKYFFCENTGCLKKCKKYLVYMKDNHISRKLRHKTIFWIYCG